MTYYVYELINSLDGKIFYVGKGSKKRMYVHEARARRQKRELHENNHLRNKIRKIWRLGGRIEYNVIFRSDDEKTAYLKEEERIKEIGIENLCNRRIGPCILNFQLNGEKIAKSLRGHCVSDETREKIKNTLQGHSVSDETREKISNSQLGKQRGPCKEWHKKNISKGRMPNGFPKVRSPSGETIEIETLTSLCREYGLNLPSMSELLKGKRKSHKGWTLV